MRTLLLLWVAITLASNVKDATGNDSEIDALFAAFPEQIDQHPGVATAFAAMHDRVLNELETLDSPDSDLMIGIDDDGVIETDRDIRGDLQHAILNRFPRWTVYTEQSHDHSVEMDVLIRLSTEVTGELKQTLTSNRRAERHRGFAHLEWARLNRDDASPERISVAFAEHPWIEDPDVMRSSKGDQRWVIGVTPTIVTDREQSLELAIAAAQSVVRVDRGHVDRGHEPRGHVRGRHRGRDRQGRGDAPRRQGDAAKTQLVDYFQQELTRDYATIYRTYVLLERSQEAAARSGAEMTLVRTYNHPRVTAVRSPASAVFRLSLVAGLFLTILGTGFILNRLSRGYYERLIWVVSVVVCLGLFIIVSRFPI